MKNLKYFKEPRLTFGQNQTAEDPRDGLLLFGPCETFSLNSVKAGVIGTREGIEIYKEYVKRLKSPIFSKKTVYGKEIEIEAQRPSFTGFEAIFGIEWNEKPVISKILDEIDINKLLETKNKKKRTKALVDLYKEKIINAKGKDDKPVDIWFVIVPRNLYISCRYGSKGEELSKQLDYKIQLLNEGQQSLYQDYDDELRDLEKLKDDTSDFHNLLKANLLQAKVESPIQIIVEPTLQFKDKLRNRELSDDLKAHLAWTQSVAVYYKLGNKPWILHDVRKEVCYLGLIFKKLPDKSNKHSACSAAQMFLADGDGAIFRGNIGLFKSERGQGYHLDENNAENLLGMALDDYYENRGCYPEELFIHGRVKFEDGEWKGFLNALENRGANSQLNGIVIKDSRENPSSKLKLFKDTKREGQMNAYGIMRGLAWQINETAGYLFTRGYIPRIGTSNHLEIANPLYIEVVRGHASLSTVMKDILALTKLNYNACIYGDGLPVTLRFSDLIGNVLTATSNWESDMRQFKYYI